MKFILNTGKSIELDSIALDLNGTLAIGGIVKETTRKKIALLKKKGFKIFLISGDARGNASKIAEELGIQLFIAKNSREKLTAVKKIPSKNIVAIGNARIDLGMFKKAKLKIITLQAEGIHSSIILKADIIVPNINDALDLFIDEKRFLSTMKK